MATKRRLAGNIRRELIAAELERLRKENAILRQSRARLVQLWQARGISARSWHAAERTWKP